MYGEIRVDGSRLLKPGKNLITVKVTRKMDGSTSESANAIDFFYSSVRESEQEDAKVEVDNNALLKEIPHGFYGDEPAGIWQPVKLSITDPAKVEDVFIKPTLNGATFDITLDRKSVV